MFTKISIQLYYSCCVLLLLLPFAALQNVGTMLFMRFEMSLLANLWAVTNFCAIITAQIRHELSEFIKNRILKIKNSPARHGHFKSLFVSDSSWQHASHFVSKHLGTLSKFSVTSSCIHSECSFPVFLFPSLPTIRNMLRSNQQCYRRLSHLLASYHCRRALRSQKKTNTTAN